MNKLLILSLCTVFLLCSCGENKTSTSKNTNDLAAISGQDSGLLKLNFDRKLMDVSGRSITMGEVAKENGLLVMFSCNTCPYVIKNQKRTLAIADFAQKMGIGVILLNSNEGQRSGEDSFEEMKRYAQEQNYNFNYVVDKDHQVADALGAKRTPECFLFDKTKKIVYHGAIDDNPTNEDAVTKYHLKNAIEAIATGKEVITKETRSVGCTIKRS